ncbi:hypothetical protein H8959_022521 [Pygathrix nigripes]
MPLLPGTVGLAGLLFWAGQAANALMMRNATPAPARPESTTVRLPSGLGVPRYRQRRHISVRDMNALLDYHNHIRASVYPACCQHGIHGLGQAAGQGCRGLGHPVHLGTWAFTADEIRGPEPLHPFWPMVWASSNRLGCAIHTCGSISVWGNTWHRAAYLVCNYAIKGNWIGEAPYKMGRPCSACPPSYQGSCNSNMCFNGLKSNKLP